ncbi:pyrimidine 5'-nucleotidase [Rhodospirillales bacterium]|nr:pyrimidine 5'-nucleotidase [Rhodospirillales bacterium]
MTTNNQTSPSIRESAADLKSADVWVFDLDNTLYPAASNLFDQVDWKMTDYVAALLSVDKVEARRLQKDYFRSFGTTMKGLMTVHDVDPHEFMAFVHDIDLSPISADTILNNAIESLPGRKVIFTNGSTPHADNITKHLGIDHLFEGCFDIVDAGFEPKPNLETYKVFCDRFDIDPTRAVMVEDMAKNLAPAAVLGMTTVWVDTGEAWAQVSAEQGHVHHRTEDLTIWLGDVVSA